MEDWRTEAPILAELRHLPISSELYIALRESTQACVSAVRGWPLSRLPHIVPRSYNAYFVRTEYLSLAEVEALVYGAPADRTVESPLQIGVNGQPQSWVNSMNVELQQAGSYHHVSVLQWDGLYG